jgi:hypothetical protein
MESIMTDETQNTEAQQGADQGAGTEQAGLATQAVGEVQAAAQQAESEVKADVAGAEEQVQEKVVHPAESVLRRIEEEINAMGGYAVSRVKHLIDEVRGLL